MKVGGHTHSLQRTEARHKNACSMKSKFEGNRGEVATSCPIFVLAFNLSRFHARLHSPHCPLGLTFPSLACLKQADQRTASMPLYSWRAVPGDAPLALRGPLPWRRSLGENPARSLTITYFSSAARPGIWGLAPIKESWWRLCDGWCARGAPRKIEMGRRSAALGGIPRGARPHVAGRAYIAALATTKVAK